MAPPAGSGPPWNPGNNPPGVAPAPPLIQSAPVPVAPYVNNVWANSSTNASSPLVWATAIQRGSAFVVFAAGQNGHGATIKDTLGNAYATFPAIVNGGGSNEQYLWVCPQSVGANPVITVTVSGSSSYITATAVEIVGANPGYLIDVWSGKAASSGTITTPISTLSPGDLILSAVSVGNGATQAWGLPSSFKLLTSQIVPGDGSLFVGCSTGTVAPGSGGPTWTSHGAANFAINTLAIRSASVWPSQPPLTGLIPTQPPGQNAVVANAGVYTYVGVNYALTAGAVTFGHTVEAIAGSDAHTLTAATAVYGHSVESIALDTGVPLATVAFAHTVGSATFAFQGVGNALSLGTVTFSHSVGALSFPTKVSQGAGSKRRFRHIYRVAIDGRSFECRSLAEALELLAQAKDFAEKHAQALARQATSGDRPQVAPVEPPKIEAPPELQGAARETQHAIELIYRAAMRDAEIAAWFAYAEKREDEDISFLLLM